MEDLHDLVSPELEDVFDEMQADMQAEAENRAAAVAKSTNQETTEAADELSRQERITMLQARLSEKVRPAGERGRRYNQAEMLNRQLIVESLRTGNATGIVRSVRVKNASERIQQHLQSIRGETQ
jgi:hypothetical protein